MWLIVWLFPLKHKSSIDWHNFVYIWRPLHLSYLSLAGVTAPYLSENFVSTFKSNDVNTKLVQSILTSPRTCNNIIICTVGLEFRLIIYVLIRIYQ